MDLAPLGISVDSSGLAKAEGDLQDFTVAAIKAEDATEDLSNASRRASAQVGKVGGAVRAGRMDWRNLGLQLNQVSQQTAATGNFMQALTIQMPDILLGFGTLGVAAGIAAPAIMGLGASLFSAGEEADSFDDALANVNDTIDNLTSAQDMLRMNTDELVKVYGEAAEAVRYWALQSAELQVAQSGRVLAENVDYARDLIDVYGSGVAVFDEFGRAADDISGNLRAIREDLGVNSEAAQVLYNAFSDLSDPGLTPDGMASALDDILKTLEDSGIELKTIPPEIQDMIIQMINFSTATAQAAEQARQLASDVANVNVGVPLYMQGFTGNELLPPAATPKPVKPKAKRGGGGSRTNPVDRDAKRIIDMTKTSLEKYNDEIASLDALLASGAITQEQYTRAVDMFGERLLETGEMGKRMGDTISDALADMVVDFDNARDAAAGLLSSLARMFASAAFAPIGDWFSGLFPSAKGNVFSGGRAVTAFANGGVVSGPTMFPMRGSQTGLMGEAGPEAIMPLTRLANGKLGVQAQGGGSQITFSPVIDARGADAGAVVRIEAALQKAQAEFSARVVSTVRTAQKRRVL